MQVTLEELLQIIGEQTVQIKSLEAQLNDMILKKSEKEEE